ncbi:glycosyltransferase family 2 protein [Pedobacter vanadiisoli]|uniref:Glycosyltransferase family 2 protein n=1 Tax=Pedobacter vanadiisoli TaxID=1761975 RepID=A0ABW5MHF4_9SPHI
MISKHNISFFIPAYNCEATVAESIDSIMLDNFEEGDELIIVNDCSTDGTEKILTKYFEKYPFIKLVCHTRNKGGGAARNTAIELAKNELLFCLDSDNVLEKGSIKSIKKYLLENQADVVSFQLLQYFSKSTAEIDYTWTLKPGLFAKTDALAVGLTPGASGNYLFTKKSWLIAGGYPEFSGALDTWGFGIKQLLTDAKVMVLEDSFYYHRLLPTSYFLRDAWNKRKSISLRATQILIPFFDQISDKDIDYMLSTKNRYNWFENIEKRPISITEEKKKDAVFAENTLQNTSKKTILSRVFNKLRGK